MICRPELPRARGALVLLAVVVLIGCSGGDGEDQAANTSPTTTESSDTTTTTEAPMDAGHRAYVYTPTVGDCFDRRRLEPDEGGGLVVLLLDCSLPHTYEVYALFEIDEAALQPDGPPEPDGEQDRTEGEPPEGEGQPPEEPEPAQTPETGPTGFPGEDALEDEARRHCPTQFEAWVGTPYELSDLEIGWVLPTEEGWENGDRTVACTVYDPGEDRVVGSQQGAGR